MGTATTTTTAAALTQARALSVDVSPVERAIAALGPILGDVEVLADEAASYAGVRARLIGDAAPLLAFHATLAPDDFRGRIWKAHREGLEALLAREGTKFVRLETRAGMPGLLTIGVDLEASCSLDDAIAHLAAATNVTQATRERLHSLLGSFGTTCLCLGDRLAPPALLTRTVWMQPPTELVRVADKVADVLAILPEQRALLARHLGLATPRWIGLRAVADEVMPEIHVAFDADPALAARLLASSPGGHDEVRALIRDRAVVEVRYHAEGKPLAVVRASTTATTAAPAAAPTISRDDLSFGVIAARVGTAAAANGIDVTALLAALQPFGASLARHTRVTMTGEADRLRVLFPVPRDPAGKAGLGALLAGGAGKSDDRPHADAVRARADAGDADHVELATTPKRGLEVWLHHEGAAASWKLVAGLVDAAWEAKLRSLVSMLDPGGPRARSRRAGTADALVHVTVAGDRAAAAIAAVAEAVGIAPSQRALIGNIHPLLAHQQDVVVSLRLSDVGVIPEVRVGYRHLPLETAVRVIAPIRPGHDAGRALGNFAGALEAQEAAVLTLVLRPEDPMRALVAIDLVPGTDLA